ncbi:hypothetical protein PybrP1_005795 [[Pythium] brassicae (nom. inval.)]|nr:hypothetical protein PybrP1_005795 [[Pythium] brassicae (nom. inval.)]
MRVVLQRVTSASVRVEGEVVGHIGRGLLCLVGVARDDTEEDAEFCCRRLLGHTVEDVRALERLRSAARQPVHASRLLLRQQARLPPRDGAGAGEGAFRQVLRPRARRVLAREGGRGRLRRVHGGLADVMTTAPLAFSRVLPGAEREGHGPVHRSLCPTRVPIPEDPSNPADPLAGLTQALCESSFHNFNAASEQFKDLPCLGRRPIENGEAKDYVWLTYGEVAVRISNVGAGMMRCDLLSFVDDGAYRMVAIYMKNSIDWVVAEQAAYSFAAVVVALYDTLGSDSTEYILNQTELATVVCTTAELKKLTQLQPKCPHLRNIVICGGGDDAVEAEAKAVGFSIFHCIDIENEGAQNPRPPEPPTLSNVATIMYTSGTTGDPKGVVLTHSNFMSSCAGTLDFLEASNLRFSTDTVHLCYLPLAHIYERASQVSVYHHGGRIGFSQGNPLKIIDDIRALRPTIFCGVPRLLNRIYDLVMAKMAAAPKLPSYLFSTALSIKIKRLKKFGSLHHTFWDRLFFQKITESVGFDRCQAIFSGSAPLSPDVINFCRVAFMLHVAEGYGQTETCAGATSTSTSDLSAGYIGGPNTAVEIKLTSVPDMNYSVTDREHGSERLACLFVTGDSFHSHLVAIVVPDELSLKKMAAANGITSASMQELCDQPALKKLIQKEIDDASVKAKLAGFERVRCIYLHHELFSVENELLTPSFKLKRGDAKTFFKKQIDQLYALSGDNVAGKNITQG